jgi:hypothetical protein
MNTRLGLPTLLLVCILGVQGCGDSSKLYPVEGTVTVDGNAIEGATVIFTSQDGQISAAGLTSASGKFKLLTNGKEGVPAGSYKVAVTKVSSPQLDTGESQPDPTKSYTEFMKKSGMQPGKQGMKATAGMKSEVPERYGKPGGLPDQVVPATGPISLEMKSK